MLTRRRFLASLAALPVLLSGGPGKSSSDLPEGDTVVEGLWHGRTAKVRRLVMTTGSAIVGCRFFYPWWTRNELIFIPRGAEPCGGRDSLFQVEPTPFWARLLGFRACATGVRALC